MKTVITKEWEGLKDGEERAELSSIQDTGAQGLGDL